MTLVASSLSFCRFRSTGAVTETAGAMLGAAGAVVVGAASAGTYTLRIEQSKRNER